MQVLPTGGQIWKKCKFCHQVTMFCDHWIQSDSRSQFLGPLCLWKCFLEEKKPTFNFWDKAAGASLQHPKHQVVFSSWTNSKNVWCWHFLAEFLLYFLFTDTLLQLCPLSQKWVLQGNSILTSPDCKKPQTKRRQEKQTKRKNRQKRKKEKQTKIWIPKDRETQYMGVLIARNPKNMHQHKNPLKRQKSTNISSSYIINSLYDSNF